MICFEFFFMYPIFFKTYKKCIAHEKGRRIYTCILCLIGDIKENNKHDIYAFEKCVNYMYFGDECIMGLMYIYGEKNSLSGKLCFN